MITDVDPHTSAGLVRREVRSGQRDGQPTKVVVAARRYAAQQADVWDAVSNRERLPRWFLPVTGELRLGGRYQFEGNAGGLVERCEPPELVGVTWEFNGGFSWLEVQLAADGDGTLLELRHETRVDPFWERFGPGGVGVGWDFGLLGLGMHLGVAAAVDPKAFDDWTVSAAGKAFVTRCVDGWTEAAIANGQEPDAARAAGAEVAAFYTAAPEQARPEAAGAE